jgi:hypothetical protein
MNDRPDDGRADLDASLDAAVRAMTSVRTIEERSRKRTLAALTEPAPRATRTPLHAWRWLGVAAAAGALLVSMMLMSRDRLEPRREIEEARAPSAPTQVEKQSQPTAHARVGRSAGRTEPSSAPAHTSATERLARRSVASRSAQPARRPAADRLAETVAALRVLPPELWERPELASIDAPSIAAPPIDAGELVAPPIEVAPMPDPSATPDSAPPGGPR